MKVLPHDTHLAIVIHWGLRSWGVEQRCST
jgi:hypothetical protein